MDARSAPHMIKLNELHAGGRTVYGEDLRMRVRRVASGLANLGAGERKMVALLMRNDLPFVEATLAAQQLGAYPVPLNWHAQPEELLYVLKDCAADVLVAHSDLLAPILSRVQEGVRVLEVALPPSLMQSYKLDVTTSDDCVAWEEWLGAQVPHSSPPLAALESVIYTSGTSGFPKGVKRLPTTATQLVATDAMRARVSGIFRGDERVLVPAPLYHTAPNLFAFRAIKHAEFLLVRERFDPAQLMEDIERYAITHVYMVPTMFTRMLALPEHTRRAAKLSSLRFVLHAGGPCAPTVKREMMEWLGPVIYEYYGSTETGPNTFITPQEWLARPGSVGRAAPGTRLEIRDDDGQPARSGTVGEICARNEDYPDFTYLNNPDARQEVDRAGLISMGDLGYLDEKEYLFICDRKRDMVISGGVNIYPAEIEQAIQEIPGVADCAVFGIPDEEFGEALAAFVQVEKGSMTDAESVRCVLKERLAKYKMPRLIEIRESIPREESGKIKKRLLRAPYWTSAGRQI
jgi:long-chain acyl-CoA synthetase